MPILALHGAYSASDEIRNVFEPILAPLDAQRRIYPDLLGMGDSPPHDAIQTTRDIIDLLDEFIQPKSATPRSCSPDTPTAVISPAASPPDVVARSSDWS